MLLWSHTGHNYTWFPMYRLLVHSRMTFFCRLVLTFKKVIVVPECFDCLWYLKAYLVAALKSHLSQSKLIPSCFYCLWSLRLPLCFALCSHWSQSIIIPSCFDCLCTLRWHFCVALFSQWSQLDLISTCFNYLWILRLIFCTFRELFCVPLCSIFR